LKREAAEESNRRLTFLARSGAIITRSLDQAVTIESILRIVVPEHAEHAVLAEQDETGSWQAVYARAAGPAAELSRSESLNEVPMPWREAIERAIVSGSVEQRLRPHAPEDDAEHELLALPLRDRERVFAVLLLTRKVVGQGYAPADVAMFESLAWRSGIALINARLYAQIERADQQKNRFLSMLAHELRNPLAPIRSAVDVLRLCGDSPADLEWARDVIDRQVNHLIRLVDDLLDVSRITLGKIRLQLESLEAAEVVTAAIEISQPLIEKSQHQLAVEVPDEPIVLNGDRARLTQVLANLLNNAAKYTPPGGTIGIVLERDGDTAVFRVHDTGIGIPPHMLDKVFDMFIQVENSLDRSQGGLGIGLTLVRELVAMHQGTIRVASEGHGCGSQFIISVPCLPAASGDNGNAASHQGAPTVAKA
jgi:signal transduction histidine kinase